MPKRKEVSDLDSEFEFDAGQDEARRQKLDDFAKPNTIRSFGIGSGRGPYGGGSTNTTERYKLLPAGGCSDGYRQFFLGLDAYARHKRLINEYVLCYPGATQALRRDTSRDRTDLDVIRENSKFLWNDDTDGPQTWAQKLAKRYWDKLFKEYCISDLTMYKENKIAMRWRTQTEVIKAKGQFICGNKHCNEATDLTSWEVNFGYAEHGERKNALVKLRLCPSCSKKLNYHHKRKPAKSRKSSKKTSDSVEESEQVPDDSGDINESAAPNEVGEPEQCGPSMPPSLDKQPPAGDSVASNTDQNIWLKPAVLEDVPEKSREADFQDFLEELLL